MKFLKVIFYISLICLMGMLTFNFKEIVTIIGDVVVDVNTRIEQTRIMGDAARDVIQRELEKEYDQE